MFQTNPALVPRRSELAERPARRRNPPRRFFRSHPFDCRWQIVDCRLNDPRDTICDEEAFSVRLAGIGADRLRHLRVDAVAGAGFGAGLSEVRLGGLPDGPLAVEAR